MAFIGPDLPLAVRKASVQRSVNLFLRKMEVEEKAAYILESVPGLAQFADLKAEIRGAIEIGSRAFVVAGAGLFEVFSDGTSTQRGSLQTTTGVVSMVSGLLQLVIADSHGYVLTLSSNNFQTITDPDFTGADTVDFQDNYFLFTKDRVNQQFYWSAINDATSVNALDFASAEGNPDLIVSHIVVQAGCLFFGERSTELWVTVGGEEVFSRSRGSGFNVGLMARGSLKRVDNGAMWLGRDENGSGIVYRIEGGQPQRISNHAVEQALLGADLTKATAYVYQDQGQTFYALTVPGVAATWVYEIYTGQWHERCDLDKYGQFKASRGTVHLYAFGKHYLGGADGILYKMDRTVYRNGSDPLVRERTSPHQAAPSLTRLFFSRFAIDCETGGADQSIDPYAELSWSEDSGATWSVPILRSIGKVGQRFARVLWTRLGSGRDRVWKLRFSGNAPFTLISAAVEAKAGM